MAIDENTIRSLLIRNKISNYKLEQIRSDASFREYYRVLDKNLLIMYAPKDKGESLVNFEKINKVLSSINLSVSKIYDADYQNDLLLIEDFGNDIFSTKLNHINENDFTCLNAEVISIIFLPKFLVAHKFIIFAFGCLDSKKTKSNPVYPVAPITAILIFFLDI